MQQSELSQSAFHKLQRLFEQASGIRLSPAKSTLVASRLRRRVEELGLKSFDAYCQYLGESGAAEERNRVVDLLTTNETYFFRDSVHFGVFANWLDRNPQRQAPRVWSAACSTGEEPYSLAMTLMDRRSNGNFRVLASDLSRRVLARAERGIYPLSRLEHMPATYLQRFCLRGRGDFQGTLRIEPALRTKVEFFRHNLLEELRGQPPFDVVFLRNVLIYFDSDAKKAILTRLVAQLAPGGLLFVGLAETIHGHGLPLTQAGRSVFRCTRT